MRLAVLPVDDLGIFGAGWVSSRKRWRAAGAGPAAALPLPALAGFDLQPLPAEPADAPPIDFRRQASEPSPSPASGAPFEAPVPEAPSHPVGENEAQEDSS